MSVELCNPPELYKHHASVFSTPSCFHPNRNPLRRRLIAPTHLSSHRFISDDNQNKYYVLPRPPADPLREYFLYCHTRCSLHTAVLIYGRARARLAYNNISRRRRSLGKTLVCPARVRVRRYNNINNSNKNKNILTDAQERCGSKAISLDVHRQLILRSGLRCS